MLWKHTVAGQHRANWLRRRLHEKAASGFRLQPYGGSRSDRDSNVLEKSGSQKTRRWRKADSNPRSRSYEWGCLVSPNRNAQLGARIKFRSSRATAVAAGPLGGRSVHGGTDGSNPLSSSSESGANLTFSSWSASAL